MRCRFDVRSSSRRAGARALVAALCLAGPGALAPGGEPASPAQAGASREAADPLAPLLFLEGRWRGEGKSPYGPYAFETEVERRGRWLLGRTSIFDPATREPRFKFTSVYGYDDRGRPVLHAFDEGGQWSFAGEVLADGLAFEWKGGKAWRRTRLTRRADGALHSESLAHFPEPPPGAPPGVTVPVDSRFESVAVRQRE